MMIKIKSFTNMDVFAITKELDLKLNQSNIINVYEIEDFFILKLNTKDGKKNLIIQSDTRVNLTEYDYPIPSYPSQYIISLRNLLKNKKILSVKQENFDRIIIIELSYEQSKNWKIVIELFNKGNFIVIDEENKIKMAKKYKKFKDRDVLAGKEYLFPISRGKDFLTISQEDFKNLIKNGDNTEIVRNIARNISIAGIFSEEICYRAGINKNLIGNELSEENINQLSRVFKELRNQLLFGDINAHIIIDEKGNDLDVLPFELNMFNNFEKRYFDSFNEAVDNFYSKLDSAKILKPSDGEINSKIKSQKKILKNQLDYLEALKLKKIKYYEQGEFIYSNFKSLENLLAVIKDALSKGYSFNQINEKLNSAKYEGIEGTEFFEEIIPIRKQVTIKFNDALIFLELKKSIGENANLIYAKGKKADKKIKGTIPAIEKTKSLIKKLKQEKEEVESEIDFLIKKPKKRWYEKYRWFFSYDDFLVIGGRDATSNEAVFKKHLESNDLILHTNFPGSPLTVIKNPNNKTIPQKTIEEAAIFVASFSKAWKETWGVVDVFYVNTNQVSKTPPTGEYLPKGSFIISGKKNFIKNAKTELSIGLKFEEINSDVKDYDTILYPKILCGPESAIKNAVEHYIIIKPSGSGKTKGSLAKQIINIFKQKFNKDMNKWIKLLSLDDIIIHLPSGLSIIDQDKE